MSETPPYAPTPLDVSQVNLEPKLDPLVQALSKNTHEIWAQIRLEQGWKQGEERDDEAKLHPSLVAFEALPEEEKSYHRNTAVALLKAVHALGHVIVSKEELEKTESSHKTEEKVEKKPAKLKKGKAAKAPTTPMTSMNKAKAAPKKPLPVSTKKMAPPAKSKKQAAKKVAKAAKTAKSKSPAKKSASRKAEAAPFKPRAKVGAKSSPKGGGKIKPGPKAKSRK